MKFTQGKIDKLELPEGKTDIIFWDDSLPGFGFRLREGGSKKPVVQYKIGSKTRRMTTKLLPLGAARKWAQAELGKVANGKDPQGEKLAARATASETFGAVAEDFIKFQTPRLRASSLYSTTLYLRQRCKRLHALKIEAVTRREIASVLGSIASHSGAVSADRAASALSKMFVWAIGQGLVDASPVIGINSFAGNIDRDRVLSDSEIADIWSALPENEYGYIIKLLFYTGARRDEIGGLKWSEIDLDECMIHLPKERSKNKRAFDLPLSAAASHLIAALDRRADRDLVFGVGDGGFQGWSKAKRELDAKIKIAPWQQRDIRRTVATGMAELGVQPHIVEACLNHVSGAKSGVAGIYNRAVYAKEKREAVEIWAHHLSVSLAKVSGANVLPLRGR